MREADELKVPTVRVEARTGRKGTWTFRFHEDLLEMTGPRGKGGGDVPLAEHRQMLTLREGLGKPMLIAKIPGTVAFELGPKALAAYKEWRGPLTSADLVKELNSWFLWAIPIGLVYILGSLPFGGDSEAGIEAAPLDIWGIALGVALIGLAILRKLWPTRTIFLLDAFWFVGLGANIVMDVVKGGSPFWLLLVLLMIWIVIGALKNYVRFRDVADEEATAS